MPSRERFASENARVDEFTEGCYYFLRKERVYRRIIPGLCSFSRARLVERAIVEREKEDARLPHADPC